jgi:hypothetical protein
MQSKEQNQGGGAAKRAITYIAPEGRGRASTCIISGVVVVLVGCGRCWVVPCWTFIISQKERTINNVVYRHENCY